MFLDVRVCFWMCGSAGAFLAVWVRFGCVGVRVCFALCGCHEVWEVCRFSKSPSEILPQPFLSVSTNILVI